jgi:5-enolpyruvylshikimate-3-phosphate synthase
MQRVTQKNKESDKLREMIRDINTLKNELREIKDLIKGVVKK